MSGTGDAQDRHVAPPSCTGSPRPDKEAGTRSVGRSSLATAVFNLGGAAPSDVASLHSGYALGDYGE